MSAQPKRFRIEGPQRSAVAPPERGADAAPDRLRPAPSRSEVARLQAELGDMMGAIAATKREVASLRRRKGSPEDVHRATCELDAVFDATERATTTILGAVEEIESAANMLRASGLEPGRGDFVGTILDRVVLLYETCNFQDITGQRIEKVVATLKFVEGRLDVLMSSWSQEGADLDAPGTAPAGDRRLGLSGPPLAGDDQISQSDIDSYFG